MILAIANKNIVSVHIHGM